VARAITPEPTPLTIPHKIGPIDAKCGSSSHLAGIEPKFQLG